ncbi:PREDICTED: receptor-like protein 12 isoform X2 [Populus euphratica]|uniref:Receptor-like protein 12 isoform X2 n=1 Tax=Populus euphratica TaxID=75702 RepID=A0AAJ6UNU4_POPEU|nr:PREDICTED: receptor-like protein 12 isoform X2 [Populus euphratica]
MPSSVRFLTTRMLLLFLLSFFHLRACQSFPSMQPLCNDEESRALLQLKENLVINESASSDPSAYPKVASWRVDGESGDCCSWEGVECDRDSAHVIGLDLSSSFLYGSINSNSSLFHLVQLRRLNLADNDFNNSEIPSEIRNLTRLFDLNLSMSGFTGQIPAEILELSKLVFLDLGVNSLKLQKPGLQDLVEALTNLEVLHLSGVEISSKVPQIMANLSSLSSLFLRECGLQGEFPMGIFQLPNLRSLSIRYNPYLTGYLPEFQSGSQLELLLLAGTSFSGQLPESIGNLKSLTELDVAESNFSGVMPSSLGNLTKLNSLDLSDNSFSGKIPPSFVNLLQLTYLSLSLNNLRSGTIDWIGNLTKLSFLDMTKTNSYGNIPSCLRNLTQLTVLKLHGNKLTGQIPSWIGNHTQFISLYLGVNKLHGPSPESIYRLQNLEKLDLAYNFFSGTLELNLLLEFRNLVSLQLSYNNLSILYSHNATIPRPKLELLTLSGCNLGELPSFLRDQNHLEFLELEDNELVGHIPKWFMNVSTITLQALSLAGNLLTGFEQSLDVLPWNNLLSLSLSSNKFQGSLPIPPPAIYEYKVSNNKLNEEIPEVICNLTSLSVLDLSFNNFSGKLPQCLGNKSSTASVLNLCNNGFIGDIPETFTSGCSLRVIDFSQNKLEGKIPKSLANCTKLEILNLEQNNINDVFPSWLGVLHHLRVLILRSNGLHGVIGIPKTNVAFPRLQIVDLSNNSFKGKLPLESFRYWTAMKNVRDEHLIYMQANTSFKTSHITMYNRYDYSMTMTNKGVMRLYEKIQDSLTAIDLSSNGFEGGIPEVLGDLKQLRLLNLSINFLSGGIPPSLSNLKELEALDLSQNKLSGEIPVQLAQLTFLEVFNVSHNFLSGPIPRVNQFGTFDNTSFDANSGLCGEPLSNKCGNDEDSLPPSKEDEGSGSQLEFGWNVVVIGYASGLVIGVILGCAMNTRKYEWLVKNYFARWHRS